MAEALKILLVDDEPIIIRSVARFLQLHNYDTTTCADGQKALELAENQTYDVVVADLNMPALDGLSLINQLRERMPDCKMIITSGAHPTDQPPIEDRVTFLSKPFDLDALMTAILEAPTAGPLATRCVE